MLHSAPFTGAHCASVSVGGLTMNRVDERLRVTWHSRWWVLLWSNSRSPLHLGAIVSPGVADDERVFDVHNVWCDAVRKQ